MSFQSFFQRFWRKPLKEDTRIYSTGLYSTAILNQETPIIVGDKDASLENKISIEPEPYNPGILVLRQPDEGL